VRLGVCRDFAVLGYCSKGLDCEHSHVRECPDFAERGECTTKGCKLPHVIRANRNRKPVSTPGISAASTIKSTAAAGQSADAAHVVSDSSDTLAGLSAVGSAGVTAEEAQIGDEYISLTFHESEEESADEGSDDDSDGDEGMET
jgi:hypothetical protein